MSTSARARPRQAPRRKRRRRRSRIKPLLLTFSLAVFGLVGWAGYGAARTAVDNVLALAGAAGQSSDPPHVATSRTYRVRPGDTIDGLATRFGVQPAVLAKVNHLSSADSIQVGQTLLVPSAYHPNRTRSLIEDTALRYGVDPALASAVAWQESGFNENVRSSTGAIGVMQVEPGTADLVARQLGRSLNLADENDNVTAGVYWLAYLHRFYGGDDERAVAAYYEGQGNLASYGYLAGTSEYVANVMALRSSFASDRPVR